MNNKDQSIRDIYISGPLFTPIERTYLEQIDNICADIGLTTYLPHRDVGFGPARGKQAEHYFQQDVLILRKSQCIVAVLNGADIDSGTAWEVGYSFSTNKYIIGIREDIRDIEINPMLICSAKITHSFDDLRQELIIWKTKI
jgi:nucleoside 2-deoxyribosyltransferase